MTFKPARYIDPFLLLTMLLNPHSTATGETPALTCTETASTELVPLLHPCIPQANSSNMFCQQRLPRMKHRQVAKMGTTFAVLDKINASDTVTFFCVGMVEMFKYNIYSRNDYRVSQLNTFEPTLSVGVMKVDTTCLKTKSAACPGEVRVRADVLATPLVSSTPDYEDFWDFSAPLLGRRAGWLRAMAVEGAGLAVAPAALRGLAGSGLRALGLRDDYHWSAAGPALADMPELRFVDVSDCFIRALPPGSFKGSPNIEDVQLNGNRLQDVPLSISRLKNLKTLSIERNQHSFNFRPEALFGLNHLQNLSFAGTPISNGINSFPALPVLRNLSLADCNMVRLKVTKLQLPELEYLNLSSNSLTYLPPGVFTDLHKLKVIDLSRNRLTEWPVLTNIHFEAIVLSNNSLSTVVNLGLSGVTTGYLDLSLNNVTHWDDSAVFAGWVPLVNLSRNHIMNVSAAMLAAMGALRAVDLGGNTLDCAACLTGPLQRWLREARGPVVLVLGARGPLRCSLPGELRGVAVLRAPLDPRACRDPRVRLWWGLGLPLCVLAAAALAAGASGYRFRTEVAYLLHLLRVRAASRRPGPAARAADACAYDAFVCYSGRNRKFVLRRLARLLERPPQRYRLCLFDRDFRLGTQIVANIADAIDTSTKVIVVLSEPFITSKWCQWELEMANHKLFGEDREFLVLLELEPLERARLPRLLRFLLDTRPVVRWPRPETAPAVLQAGAQLRRALGPSLRQRQTQAQALPRPGSDTADERAPLLPAVPVTRI